MAVEGNIKEKSRSSGKFPFVLGILILSAMFVIAAVIYVPIATFKFKAEGISIGYQRAASAAYQMGRPIPDTIFEEGNYRVEVKTSFNSSGQPSEILVNVKDIYTNMTHYTSSRSLSNIPQQIQNGIPNIPQPTQSP